MTGIEAEVPLSIRVDLAEGARVTLTEPGLEEFRLSRSAIDRAFQGIGLGSELLSDALRRCLSAAEIVGARAVVAHAIDDEAVRFYQRHGFTLSPLGERVMLLPMETVLALFED